MYVSKIYFEYELKLKKFIIKKQKTRLRQITTKIKKQALALLVLRLLYSIRYFHKLKVF